MSEIFCEKHLLFSFLIYFFVTYRTLAWFLTVQQTKWIGITPPFWDVQLLSKQQYGARLTLDWHQWRPYT